MTGSTLVAPGYAHLRRLSDDQGLFEHARFAVPRPEHGYCVDDVARALVVICREPRPDPAVRGLAERFLLFVLAAVTEDGTTHNRKSPDGEWTDRPDVGDWWGRAIWGLGVAAASAPTTGMRDRARDGLDRAARARSPYLHANVFAALGAAELLGARPADAVARELLAECAGEVRAGVDNVRLEWPWPQERLRYANGAVAEALIAGGDGLADGGMLADGLLLLDFLLRTETLDGHLSVTPVAGRGLGDARPAFDQQPIEVSSLADACGLAFTVTAEPRWRDGVRMAWAWFVGDNDRHTAMVDWSTGGGYDGLTPDGPNLNQGAESTLAMLATAQHARRLGLTT